MSDPFKYWITAVFFLAVTTNSSQSHAADAIANPVFTKDILPILQENCQVCHRPGQVAPMSLLTYAEVRPWAKSIAKEVLAKNMPPFHASSPKNHFKNDPRLSNDEIQLITDWVSIGAPQGNPALAPNPIEWGDAWFMEKPDQILDFPKVDLKGKGVDDYVLFFSDHVFPEDTWVQAMEFRPSDFERVHHAGIFAVNSDFDVPDQMLLLDDNETETGLVRKELMELVKHNHLFTWVPGIGAVYRGEGQGYLVKKGERFVIQAHFAPSDTTAPIEMSVGLQFVDGKITAKSKNWNSALNKFTIPAFESSYVLRDKRTLAKGIVVEGFRVHMHLRGKSSKINFVYPDGTVETAFDVPRYSFDWQREYHLAESYTLPKGTQVEFVAEWDNSTGNPFNPDPSQAVVRGGKTTQEMYGGTIFYTVKLDTPITVENGRVVE